MWPRNSATSPSTSIWSAANGWIDPTGDRWLPYATATYTFSDVFNASLGAGYYFNDDPATADFAEYYSGFTLGKSDGANLTTEFYYEPDTDGAGNYYYRPLPRAPYPFAEKVRSHRQAGLRGYEDEASTPSYTWGEARLNYNWNDHVTLGAAVHGSALMLLAVRFRPTADCDTRVFAALPSRQRQRFREVTILPQRVGRSAPAGPAPT
ncbi:MAG: hypothetical protein U1E15_11455 [Hyphomicrobiales bacterium]